jgi:hypothetical protein
VVPDIYNVFTAPHIQSWIFDWTYLRCCLRYTDICMRVILQIWSQIQSTSSGLRYANCSSRPFIKYFQHRIFRLQYSAEGSSLAIVGISTIQWALCCKLGVNYSAVPLAFAMWTVVPHVYNVFTAPHIQSWIFDWTYLRCCWRYADICMQVILQILCQIQSPSSGLLYVNCGPGHIQCIYSSAYSDFNVHLNGSALILEISRQFNSRYTAKLVPNTVHILRFTLCELWTRTYTKYFQNRIFWLQYSAGGICAAIVHITTIRCALYCKLVAKCSAYPPTFAMWTVVLHIYNVFTAPHI